MKKFVATLFLSALFATPMAFAQNGSTPTSGGSTGASADAYRTQTLVGIGAGVVAAGTLIALAADDDDGGNVDLTSTTTDITTTPTTTTTTN
jgi:hypothetical protein